MSVAGLSQVQLAYLRAVKDGLEPPVDTAAAMTCGLRGWVRQGKLTDDGHEVLARAEAASAPAASSPSAGAKARRS